MISRRDAGTQRMSFWVILSASASLREKYRNGRMSRLMVAAQKKVQN